VFKNRVLRRKSGPKTDEIMGSCTIFIVRSFITGTLRQMWSDLVKEDEKGRACSTHESEKEFIDGFAGKHEGKRPL
jgi:hypothetical protein